MVARVFCVVARCLVYDWPVPLLISGLCESSESRAADHLRKISVIYGQAALKQSLSLHM